MDWAEPGLALIAGIVLVGFSAFAAMRAPVGRTNDPLAPLFDTRTFEKELARVELRAARPCPRMAQRHRDNAQSDPAFNLAQMMRAGSHCAATHDRAVTLSKQSEEGQWEEILLLPPPEAASKVTAEGSAV